jgi:hypothetical protein
MSGAATGRAGFVQCTIWFEVQTDGRSTFSWDGTSKSTALVNFGAGSLENRINHTEKQKARPLRPRFFCWLTCQAYR